MLIGVIRNRHEPDNYIAYTSVHISMATLRNCVMCGKQTDCYCGFCDVGICSSTCWDSHCNLNPIKHQEVVQ